MKNIFFEIIDYDGLELFDFLSIKKTFDININILQDGCLLCSESTPRKCHRRLFAEFLLNKFRDKSIQIVHL